MSRREAGTTSPIDTPSITTSWTATIVSLPVSRQGHSPREPSESDAQAGAAVGASSSLSLRERAVLERIGEGMSNKEIAKDLSITPETVKSHVKNIFVKLVVERRAQAVARALSLGLMRASCRGDGFTSPVSDTESDRSARIIRSPAA